jgi:hypothetical protein
VYCSPDQVKRWTSVGRQPMLPDQSGCNGSHEHDALKTSTGSLLDGSLRFLTSHNVAAIVSMMH